MKVKAYAIILVIILYSLSCAMVFAAESYDKLLTVANVAKVTGLTGIKNVAKNSVQGAFGQLNYVGADGQVVLVVTIETADPKAFAKTAKTDTFRSLYAGPLKGIGDVTYESPVAGERYMVAFLKGDHWATVSSKLNYSTMKPIISMKQLREIAELMIVNGKW